MKIRILKKEQKKNRKIYDFSSDMLVRMQVDKLREATRKRDRELLEKAIEEAQTANLDAPEDIKKAEEALAILQAKNGMCCLCVVYL